MKFCVCIKQVPDVSAPIQVQGGELIRDAGRVVLNAYDASAVEAALVLVEQYGGEVEVVLIGEEQAKETIRKALAMGADTAIHILTPGDVGYDSMGYAALLADHFEQAEYDFILCGKQAQDTDAGLTGSMLAERLGLPYATNAVGLDLDAERRVLVVTRQGDTGQEIIELPAPALVTCSNDMNDPRIPNIKGIMQAKRKPIGTKEASAAGDGVGAATRTVQYEPLPEREPGRMLEGDADEMVQALRRLLESEAGVL